MPDHKTTAAKDAVQDDSNQQASDGYKKLPDNPDNTGESISKADNTAMVITQKPMCEKKTKILIR